MFAKQMFYVPNYPVTWCDILPFESNISYMYEHCSTMKPVQANLYEAVTLS